jgi:hypothetical protein
LPGDHIELEPGREKGVTGAERLSNKPLKAISFMGIAIAARGANAELQFFSGTDVYAEKTAYAPLSFFRYAVKFTAGPKAKFLREAGGRFQAAQAERVLRPARRRRLITFRPPVVFILARKPIDFLRRSLLGW